MGARSQVLITAAELADIMGAGDPVTIVDCNGDNWCRISKPRKGWVWGGDLNR